MSNEAIHMRELPTLNFIMRKINEQKTQTSAGENERTSKLFYRLVAAQILQIAIGAVLAFFIAPASLFVSRAEAEAAVWIAAALAGIAMVALGVIEIVLSIVAAVAFHKEKSWRNIIGIITAVAALFAFPFGTIAGGILLRRIFKARK